MHPIKGIFGITYSCSNKTINYCDDWYTDRYSNIFANNNSIRSLYNVRYLGFNNIRTYYLDPSKDHTLFLSLCDHLNLSVEVGISNQMLDTKSKSQISTLIKSVKNYKCVKLYRVGNEYVNSIDNIIFAIEIISSMEPLKYIMHSTYYDNNFNTVKKIYQRIPNYIKQKFIIGINLRGNSNIFPNLVNNFYNDYILKDAYLIVTEFGTPNNDYRFMKDGLDIHAQFLLRYPKYLGIEILSYTDESWKGNSNNNNSYGILTEGGEKKSTYQAILDFNNLN